MTMQESVFGVRVAGLGRLPDDSAFPLVGLGRRPLVPAPPGMGLSPAAPGLGAVLVSETMTPPAPLPGPSAAPLCASCTTTDGGIAATSAAADQALREEGCIAGLGQEPEGVGKAPGGKFHVLSTAPARCTHWLLAFVNGSKKSNVVIHGHSFSYQGAINYFAKHGGGGTVYFTFTNNKGTYLFAYELVKGIHAIKICTNGFTVHRTAQGKAPFTVYPGSSAKGATKGAGARRGLGTVFTSPFPGYNTGGGSADYDLMIEVIDAPVNASFEQVWPADPTGQWNISSRLQSDMQQLATPGSTDDQSNASTDIGALLASGSHLYSDGSDTYLFFGMSDPHEGAAQTPGEPPGVIICRAHQTSAGIQIGMATSNATTASVSGGGGGVALSGSIPINVAPTLPIQTGNPPSPGLWWWQAMWIYYAPSGSGLPSTPPSGFAPPNQGVSPSGEVGKWVQTSSGHWDWYPPGTNGTPYGSVVGGDGVTYGVYASSGSVGSGGTAALVPPPATAPPAAAGTVGQWINPHPAYYIWIATSTATTTTSSAWIWLLLGLTVVGGGAAYYLLD
jgi:hypothetical protein